MSVSSGTMSVGVMAIFSGLLGAYGLRAVLLGETEPPPPPEPVITVPLAVADLPAGRKIALSDIAMHQMTRKVMGQKGFNSSEVMLGTEFLVGRTLERPVKKDQPFLTSSVYLEGDNQNLAELLQPGERAVSIEVAKRRGGNLAPGTAVDVLFRSAARDAGTANPVAIPETTVTLLENVRVLFVEKPSGSSGSNGQDTLDLRLTNGRFLDRPKPMPLVTLAVSLPQANMLQTVEGRGELTLIPRAVAVADAGSIPAMNNAPPQRMTLETLLGVQAPPKPFVTEIYRGGSRQAKQFDEDGKPIELAQ